MTLFATNIQLIIQLRRFQLVPLPVQMVMTMNLRNTTDFDEVPTLDPISGPLPIRIRMRMPDKCMDRNAQEVAFQQLCARGRPAQDRPAKHIPAFPSGLKMGTVSLAANTRNTKRSRRACPCLCRSLSAGIRACRWQTRNGMVSALESTCS